MSTEPTEAEVRALRVAIYGQISDESWEQVRENWMREDAVEWLRENQPKEAKP